MQKGKQTILEHRLLSREDSTVGLGRGCAVIRGQHRTPEVTLAYPTIFPQASLVSRRGLK